MSEVRWADQDVQRADERRQMEKSDAEKRTSHAAFEKRLQQERTTKEGAAQQANAEKTGKAQSEEQKQNVNQQQAAAQKKGAEKAKGQAAKKAPEQKESAVLAHVRQQAAQHGKPLDRRASVMGEQAAAAQRDAEAAASQSQEGGKALVKGRDQGLKTGKADEKDRAKEMSEKDKVKESEKDSVRTEQKSDTQQAQASQGAQAQQNVQSAPIDPDQQRRQQGNQGGQQGGQQQQPGQVTQSETPKGPSAQSLKRANKAKEIQLLCEKLLDNFYMGAAPDGSAMMRMELKEGVLAGLVIDLRVDDKRRVKLALSGPSDAVDFVVASRGELARALSRKGLELATCGAA